jgi:hypothetical protein
MRALTQALDRAALVNFGDVLIATPTGGGRGIPIAA